MNSGRWWRLAVLVLGLAAGRAAADGPKPAVDPKAFDKLVVDSLKEVHNRGADLYNVGMDFAGAWRLYEGGLMAVRPLLGHRPDEQKLIDTGLAAAEKEPEVARKAFLLHETIEKVRANLRTPRPEAKQSADPAKAKGPGEVAKGGAYLPSMPLRKLLGEFQNLRRHRSTHPQTSCDVLSRREMDVLEQKLAEALQHLKDWME